MSFRTNACLTALVVCLAPVTALAQDAPEQPAEGEPAAPGDEAADEETPDDGSDGEAASDDEAASEEQPDEADTDEPAEPTQPLPEPPPPREEPAPPTTAAAPEAGAQQAPAPTMTRAQPAVGVDNGSDVAEGPSTTPPESTLALELNGGVGGRLGGEVGLEQEEPVDMTFGGGVWYAPSRLLALGLSYQRTGLGGGETNPFGNSLSAQYDLNTVWLGGRAYPLRGDSAGLFVGLRIGASWQEINANGTRLTQQYTSPAEVYSCSETDGPAFALGGGVGVDVDIDRHLAFLTMVEGSAHQTTGDYVGSCAPGVGSVTNITARLGFQYRFDMDASSPQTASGTARTRRY